ncbi:hypothetical protein Fmac_018046 [Flemingia macrophylla]|uniref:EF-hand domain-containing protein n=1 Tax=Flemingia macrophylla TaxID=520843 RepID=A0ABD1M3U4_9FABA
MALKWTLRNRKRISHPPPPPPPGMVMGQEKITLTTPSPSFRLRCRSLNSLRLRRIFDMFDKNGDGMITVTEISQALSLLGLEADVEELESMTRSYIRAGNDGLTYEDFVALHESLGDAYFGGLVQDEEEAQQESDLWEAFKVFDENGDGYISAKELQVVLHKLGLVEGNAIDNVHRMIGSVDTNNDGRVDFYEFKDMMRATIVPSS